MKKIIAIILFILIFFSCTVYAENEQVVYTKETDIKCIIDGIHIDSYAINGYMYVPLDKLKFYGFNIDENDGMLSLNRKKLFYFDGDYTDNNTNKKILPVRKNSKTVLINNNIVNTYLVDDKIVIQADELLAFGTVEWVENSKTVRISIVIQELEKAFESAENKVYDPKNGSGIYRVGQMENGIYSGIVKMGYFQEMQYLGYMIDGEYEGVVYGYRKHVPYLSEQFELKTIKNGKKNGYCQYNVGFNNKPLMCEEVKSVSGIYENDKLKAGYYTKIIDYNENTATFLVKNFIEQIVSSTKNYFIYEKSETSIFYGSEKIVFDVQPVIENDRTLIPLRGLFEKLGAEVTWDDSSRTATVINENTVCLLR